MQPSPLKILGAFSLPMFSKGFVGLFNRKPAYSVTTTSDSKKFFSTLTEDIYHVLVIDEAFLEIGILPAMDVLKSTYPQLKIILLTPSTSAQHIQKLLKTNPHGIIANVTDGSEVLHSFPVIYNEILYICPRIGSSLSATEVPDFTKPDFLPSYQKAGLSAIEIQILTLKLSGKSKKQISGETYKAPETIRSHIKNINKKLVAHGLTHIVEYCRKLIPPDGSPA